MIYDAGNPRPGLGQAQTWSIVQASDPRPWFITGFVPRLTRQVPLVDQELLTLPEHLCSPPVFSRVRVSRSLVLGVCFIYHCLSFCTFSLAVCCLLFFDLWIMITPLVSSNSPYIFKVNTISNTSICPGWQTKYDIINLIYQLIN
jgi:hypothetical protein